MNKLDRIAVCSKSFSRNEILRQELLQRYQNVTFNDKGLSFNSDLLIEFLRGHSKAIIGIERLDDFVLSALPELKVIGKYGVGLDKIDMKAVKQHGKRIGWINGVNKRSVSELVIAFMISTLRHVSAAQKDVLSGSWQQHVGEQLTGRTVGLIGCGNVGKDLVKLLKPFECKVLAYDIINFLDFYRDYDIEPVRLEELLIRSDIVTLHVPLDDSTKNLLNAERLNTMKPRAILINTARGGLIDENELKVMLKEKRLAAAALDVFSIEPPDDFELLELPNFLCTPHIGGSSIEAIIAMGRAAIDSLDKNRVP